MYECENANCDIQRIVKKELGKYYGASGIVAKRKLNKRSRNRKGEIER